MQPAAQRTTKTYRGEGDYRHGIEGMQRGGWRIVSTATHQPRSGCMRVLMLGGIGALIWKPKERYIVSFER